ncbi:protein translocase subunit SecF [Dongshaea marina]|uniref:protein translocase subunit SecF n=1 Tax=Dongshaea marina TaxID=2047966 RepID=UPI000D3EC7B1|nr:protein translocase subunit SecF [Dongshaea marina]
MFQILKPGRTIPFMRFAVPASVFSLILVVLAVASICIKGFNWGLDFTGGTVIEISFSHAADLPGVREVLKEKGVDALVQNYGTSRDIMIRMAPSKDLKAAQQGQQLMDAVQSKYPSATLKQMEFVGPSVGKQLAWQGGLAVLVALLCILMYVSMRFEWRLALGAVLALAHDVIITVGIFSFFHIEFDLTVLAAVLTVVGYSLNDTIVVFDRVRENFRRLRKGDSVRIIDVSMTETLSRTLITSATTLVVVISLYVWGGAMIHNFSLLLVIGIGFGTYSSIYVASAFAMFLGVKREHLMPPKVEKEGADLP